MGLLPCRCHRWDHGVIMAREHSWPESRDPVRLLVDHVSSMLAYWDKDLLCRFANDAYRQWFGVDPDKLIGTSIRDLLGPALFALNQPYIEAVLRGEEQLFERAVPGPGGVMRHSLANYIPDVVNGDVVGFLVPVTDVTLLKTAEAALRVEIAGRERAVTALREAQRLGRIGSWEWDVQSDTTTWSDAMYDIFDLDPSRPPPRLTGSSQRYEARSFVNLTAAVEKTLQTGEGYIVELEYLKADGGTGWIEARGECVRDDLGQIVKLRGTALEITARRRAEELRIQRDVAHVANRNKTELLSRVSHELRTPLNGILGGAEVLSLDRNIGDKQRRWLNLILSSGQHMLKLVDEVLDISAAELGHVTIHLVPIDLSEVLRDSLLLWAPRAREARVDLVSHIPDGDRLAVMGDAKRLRQVIDNLLSNAIKYNHAEGEVSVAAERIGGHVALTVADTGIGMSPE